MFILLFLLFILTGCGNVVGQLTCNHEYKVTEETKPTCTNDGQVVSTCELCGFVKKEKVSFFRK